jgi:hypothetical protein
MTPGERGVVIILGAAALLTAAPAPAQTVTCTTVNTVRSCRGLNGYTSSEVMSNGTGFGSDNQGRKWTRSRSNTLTP